MWQRMPMGAKIAPEVFQRLLSNLLGDIPRTFVFYDDILIAGESQEDHDEILNSVLQKLVEKGITLNKDKCQFAQERIEFLGHTLTTTGIFPAES